jgi:hypothetical protein
VLRELLRHQDARLEGYRVGLLLTGLGQPVGVWSSLAGHHLVQKDYVPSGFDPEFELLALPGSTFHARIFYMSTVANPDTHMFEAKAEVLGVSGEALPAFLKPAPRLASNDPKDVAQAGLPSLSDRQPRPLSKERVDRQATSMPFWPGFTAKIRFPLKSNPNACVVPEEAVRASERGFIAFVPVEQKREDGKTEWIARVRTLDLGFRADGWVEVRRGLSAGEWLVRRGAEALEDGTPITFPKTPG